MAYTCRICGSNEVVNPGDVCELCAIGTDPYAVGLDATKTPQDVNNGVTQSADSGYTQKHTKSRKILLNGGAVVANTDPYGNDMSVNAAPSSVHIYSAGQVPAQATTPPVVNVQSAPQSIGNPPATSGIVKNVTIDNQQKSFIVRWFGALFGRVPFLIDNEVTMFQIFPDFSGTSTNASGNACDQVIVYGRLNHGAISENNDVEVYGSRDTNNNIIAKTIKNKASGTVVKPTRVISRMAAWLITLAVVPLVMTLAGVLLPLVIIALVLWFFIKRAT